MSGAYIKVKKFVKTCSFLGVFTSNPGDAKVGDSWILDQQRVGKPIGLLLSLTYAKDAYVLVCKQPSGLVAHWVLEKEP